MMFFQPLIVAAAAMIAGVAPPFPDPWGDGPVTIVGSHTYLPGGPAGQWAYCLRPARELDGCQWIPHPPFDPALGRQGIG